jgi:hypothetical protein
LIIDPFNSVPQLTDRHEIPHALNIIDDNNLLQIETLEQRCRYVQAINATEDADACGGIMGYIGTVSGDMFSYDARIFA